MGVMTGTNTAGADREVAQRRHLRVRIGRGHPAAACHSSFEAGKNSVAHRLVEIIGLFQ